MSTNDEAVVAPGELTDHLLAGVVSLNRTRGPLTRTSADGLSEAHKREVRMLAAMLRTRDADLVTATFLRAHGNAGSAEAMARWKRHVEAALSERV